MHSSLRNDLIEKRARWYGELTVENLEAIAQRLRSMLTGRRYTWVAVNEYYGPLPRPEVRTGQQIEPGKSQNGEAVYIHYGEDRTWGMIGINDTYGCWSISTDDRPEKRPYLVFEYNKLTIEHYAPGGNKLIWVIASEDE